MRSDPVITSVAAVCTTLAFSVGVYTILHRTSEWSTGARQLLWRSMSWLRLPILGMALLAGILGVQWLATACFFLFLVLHGLVRFGWRWQTKGAEAYAPHLGQLLVEISTLVFVFCLNSILSLYSEALGRAGIFATPVVGLALFLFLRQLTNSAPVKKWWIWPIYSAVFWFAGAFGNRMIWEFLCQTHNACG